MLEWMIVVGCIGAVLSAEMLNTAIEDLCNKVEPNTDPVIGKIKDMMGGFVLIVCTSSAVIGLLVFKLFLTMRPIVENTPSPRPPSLEFIIVCSGESGRSRPLTG